MRPYVLIASALLASSHCFAAETLSERVAKLQAEVTAAEDIRAIKRLQRTYGYYLDKGMWTDLAEYFTDDAVANYPAGVFIGKESIRQHLYLNIGNVKVGEVGLGDNRLYNHMNIQPVVHLDANGQTAKGRWRAFAYFGSMGGDATWAEGVYEMQYAKDHGVWKIAKLDYHAGFGAPYATGWVAPTESTAPRAQRQLAHPADRERDTTCEGFPAACIAPFHYANPSTLEGGHVWNAESLPHAASKDIARVTAELAQRVDRLRDEQDIENLQRIYGYYRDRAQWDQVADLFANNATIEMDQRGVYVGRKRIREFLGSLGPQGLVPGWMNDHFQLQMVVDVAADGRTAHMRSREFSLTGRYGEAGQWSEGIYENAFVKDRGVWKIQSLHYYPTFITDYDKGWAKDAQTTPGVSSTLPPDRPPSQVYAIYPKAHVPPYHYKNPISGNVSTYPAASRGGPDASLARSALFDTGKAYAKRTHNVASSVAKAEQQLARVKDYHEIENLQSAYGYYLDKNLWTDLSNLFARDGSIELAQRGIYKGPRVREFLFKVFGRGNEGPVAGRLGNHMQLQPVIHVADDGKRANVRVRMFQQMSFGTRASLGGAVYENEFVKEDGVWKFKVDHTYNTFSADYQGGWARAPGRGMPGPNADFAWDAPPSQQTAMFPIVYEIPYHYANPVNGRSELPSLPTIATQLVSYPIPTTSANNMSSITQTHPEGMSSEIATALREIGAKIDGAKTAALYAPLHPKEPYSEVKLFRDVAYGSHERHRLDVFIPPSPQKNEPIVVFIHGGGFSRGAKHTEGSPFYDNIGLWAASHGFMGVTVNYRLSPQFPFPAGADDMALLVSWLKEHAHEYGGDAKRIFLWGHSAGGAHTADYIVRQEKQKKELGIAAAILTSGIYSLGSTVSIWKDYYGDDVSKYPERESLPLLIKSPLPMLVTYAELDPPNFVPDSENLIRGRLQAGKPIEALRLLNHSHISETYAVGTSDTSLSTSVSKFIREISSR